MEHAVIPPSRPPRAWSGLAILAGVGIGGVLMAHAPMVFSGFRRLQTDLGDSRLIHYLLEHGYLWLRGAPAHREFWSPPIFYPARNMAAYTDLMISVGPPYWVYRALGGAPDLSFGLWMVTMSALNFAAGVLLFRKGLGMDAVPSAAGAFLVAFGAPRINQMGHQQLLPTFYVLVSVHALARLFGDKALDRPMRWACWLVAALGCVLQFYAGIYLAWFLVVGVGIAAVTAVALRSCRGAFLDVVKRDMAAILAATAVGMLLLVPLVQHFLPVSRHVAVHRTMALYRLLHPYRISWLNVGPGNWVWGWTADWPVFRLVGFADEHHLGFGVLTTLACAMGLYLGRDRPICRLAAAVIFAIWFSTSYMPKEFLLVAATGVAFSCAAGLFRDTGEPASRAAGLAILLGAVFLLRFPNAYLQALYLGLIVLCLLEIHRPGATPVSRIIAAFALAVVCLKLFAVEVMPTATAFSAAVAAFTAIVFKRRRREIGLVALISCIVFLAVITYLDRPGILIGGLASIGLALVAVKQEQLRVGPRIIVCALLFALPLMVVYFDHDSLWLSVYDSIPGGVGIRAVGRVVLILLIPAAFGMATLVQRLQRRGLRLASVLVASGCMIEQVTATGTYDAAANRDTIRTLAGRVDPACETLYYRPCEDRNWIRYQLDAMWASLESGKPTINGYSGYNPPGWDGFFLVETEQGPRPRDVLDDWIKSNDLQPDRVQWIGAECPDAGFPVVGR
jgi:hypothetical protein